MAADSPMPLDILLETMRRHWREGRLDEATALAKAAAPYLHARAGAGRETVTLASLEDEQLDELWARAVNGEGAARRDTA